MKNVYTFLFAAIFALCSSNVGAQSFKFTPGRVITESIPASSQTEISIYMENISAVPIQLKWRRLQNTLPSSWDRSLCDNGSCLIDIPDSGTTGIIKKAGSGFLKLTVNPMQITGAGVVKFLVYNTSNLSDADTLTISVTASATAGIASSQTWTGNLSIYPNPATTSLNVESDLRIQKMEVYNLTGQKVMEAINNTSLTLAGLPHGNYILKVIAGDGSIAGKVFVKE